MRISGSCISAHFYRIGEGAPGSPFALLGAAVGFALGFASWNTLYLSLIQQAPVIWLPRHLGYGGSALLQCAALAALAWGRAPVAAGRRRARCRRRHGRCVAGRAAAALARRRRRAGRGLHRRDRLSARRAAGRDRRAGQPGAHGGLRCRLAAGAAGGLDGFAGCATAVKQALLSNNGVFVLSLVAGAWAAALAAGAFKPRLPSAAQISQKLRRRRADGLGRHDRAGLHRGDAAVGRDGGGLVGVGLRGLLLRGDLGGVEADPARGLT